MKFLYIALAIIAIIAAFQITSTTAAAGLMGGWNKQDPQNEEFRELWNDKVQGLFLSQINAPNVDQINTRPFIVGISTQVVAGLNIKYTVKFDNKLYAVTAFRDLQKNVSVTAVTPQ